MASEESPLLISSSDGDNTVHEVVYDRFARELHSTHAGVGLTISLSTFATAIGTLVWAAYSSFSFVLNIVQMDAEQCICAGYRFYAMSNSLQSLLFWQFVQTFGCSGGLSLGTGVIGDMYKLEERGIGIGIFLGATLFGFAVTPFLGGAAAQYWSWRNLHYSLAALGLLELLLIYVSFPETSHPGTLGIHKLSEGDGSISHGPNLFAVMLASSLALISDYVLLVPLAYTIGVRYGIANKAIIAACFLPNELQTWRKKRKGVWSPEDRLRATWIGGMFMVPLSIGVSGLLTAYVGGPIGLLLNLLCLFVNGTGVVFVLNPIGSYNVDVVHSQSAEITAANVGIRSLILSVAAALVIPSIEHIGVVWTDIIVAVLAFLGQGIIFLTIRYGDRMRASVNVGFSTIENT
ncbi:MFS general substrate transporter [Suillus weaverae]|nr:MFS general substrate transporter [Suillus weaverae]